MPAPETEQLLQIADLCVKCGQCLSVCPTYNLYTNEAESPRGRITLIQGLLRQQINAADETTLMHLDHCLCCGSCEAACPSGVEYLKLLDASKQLFSSASIPHWQLELLTSKKLFKTGLQFSKFIPEQLVQFLPDIFASSLSINLSQRQIPGYIEPSARVKTQKRGKVGIFTGCIGQFLDNRAIQLTRALLEHCGYEVAIPNTQVCCGAIYQHEGYLEKAEQLGKSNQQIFSELGVEQVIFFATGCGSQLIQKQSDFPMPIIEATHFIASLEEVTQFRGSVTGKIAIHKPCTLQRNSDNWSSMLGLVKAIAGDLLVELPANDTCCGSGGLHQLKYPQAASQLLESKLESLREISPEILLTSNTGCSLHFYNGIIKSGLDIRVMHPAEWVSHLLLSDFNPFTSDQQVHYKL
jgi:glycolate oxidase iron-sulfur subunit